MKVNVWLMRRASSVYVVFLRQAAFGKRLFYNLVVLALCCTAFLLRGGGKHSTSGREESFMILEALLLHLLF